MGLSRVEGSTMTKKDYELIANIINQVRMTTPVKQRESIREVILLLAGALKYENERFNEIKFFKSCGIIS